MKTIYCDPLETGQFVRTLEYAKEKKKEEYDRGLMTKEGYEYDLNMINRLLERIKGNYSKYEYRRVWRDGKNN